MRFVFAIIATVIAAAMIVLGIGQRTVWAPPESLTAETALDSSAPYAVIDGSTLGANPGRQTITVEGSGDLVVAYAPTSDVLGWVGGSSYDAIGYERADDTLTSAEETGSASSSPPTSRPPTRRSSILAAPTSGSRSSRGAAA